MKKNYQKYFLPNISMARKRLQKSLTKRHVFNFPKSYRILGQNRSFFIKTYGCQSNIYDSENIKGILISLGFKPASSITNADLIILNTCAIRENAEKKVFGEVGFLKKMKTTNPQLLFGICGCMPQEEKTIDKIVKINHVDFVFGTHNIYMLPEILDQVINHHQKVIQVFSKEGDVIEGLPISRNSQIKAFVNVMYGCDKFCTYCIVPYTRGRMRSRSKEDIISEINNLITQGYKEVTLIGQNVNSYGIDLSKKYRFWDLLKDVANTKIPRVRFVTSNP
jgi:tRNA-2-methylthio-N6-dimethylallyladenosine synthase